MPLDPRVYLWDIKEACELVLQFAAGRTLPEYESDIMMRSAVERQLTIAGEAVTQLLQVDPAFAKSI